MATIRVKPQHLSPLRAGHPWVFAQAIERLEGEPLAGDAVDVLDQGGQFLGRGFYSAGSAIPVRLLTRRRNQLLDVDFFRRRVESAIALRRDFGLPDDDTTGFRLVNAEGDGLAGLTVDVFGDALVLRFSTRGMAQRRDDLCQLLVELWRPKALYEARGDRNQAREGLHPSGGLLRGRSRDIWTFKENGLEYAVELPGGQKTGFYFDQRENRARVAELAAGRRVLDLCCYVGGFSLAAARAGAAEVTAVDTSALALLAAEQHRVRNALPASVRFVRAEARAYAEQIGQRRGQGSLGLDALYDLVVLDPPKLMVTKSSRVQARKAYRALNAAVLRVVASGGLLVTCSCSGRMGLEEFLRLLGLASHDAGRRTTVVEVRGAGPDHPSPPAFDGGQYLKCVLLRVES